MDLVAKEYESKFSVLTAYLKDLERIVLNSGSALEGNCFYRHLTLDLFPELRTKQINLFWCGKQATQRICEIGFNAGHSTLLMLLGRDETPIDFTVFDIGHHKYTKPTLEYIRSKFQHVNFEYIEGDSTVTMPIWINEHRDLVGSYDVVHVDGGHGEHCIRNDMINANILVKTGGIIIIDDTDAPQINKYVNQYINTGTYVELNILRTTGYPHRAIRKLH